MEFCKNKPIKLSAGAEQLDLDHNYTTEMFKRADGVSPVLEYHEVRREWFGALFVGAVFAAIAVGYFAAGN